MAVLAETNNFVSQGDDTITTHSGSVTITAARPSTTVNNVDANLTFYGRTGTTTVYGGMERLPSTGQASQLRHPTGMPGPVSATSNFAAPAVGLTNPLSFT